MNARRRSTAAAVLLLALSACGPSVTVRRLEPAPYNLGPVRELVLAAVDGPGDRETRMVRDRFVERVDQQGVFHLEDAAPSRPDIFDFFERLFSKEKSKPAQEASDFRKSHPAEIYVRLRVTSVHSYKRSSSDKKKDGSVKWHHWADGTASFQVTLVDGKDGTSRARFMSEGRASSPIYDDWRDDLRDMAEREAVTHAVDDALAQFTPRRVSESLSLDDKAPRAKEGIELIKKDKLNDARLLWEKARSESGESAGLAYNLGCVSEALGDTKAAAEWYADAIRLDPSSERNRKAEQDLKRRLDAAERMRKREI